MILMLILMCSNQSQAKACAGNPQIGLSQMESFDSGQYLTRGQRTVQLAMDNNAIEVLEQLIQKVLEYLEGRPKDNKLLDHSNLWTSTGLVEKVVILNSSQMKASHDCYKQGGRLPNYSNEEEKEALDRLLSKNNLLGTYTSFIPAREGWVNPHTHTVVQNYENEDNVVKAHDMISPLYLKGKLYSYANGKQDLSDVRSYVCLVNIGRSDLKDQPLLELDSTMKELNSTCSDLKVKLKRMKDMMGENRYYEYRTRGRRFSLPDLGKLHFDWQDMANLLIHRINWSNINLHDLTDLSNFKDIVQQFAGSLKFDSNPGTVILNGLTSMIQNQLGLTYDADGVKMETLGNHETRLLPYSNKPIEAYRMEPLSHSQKLEQDVWLQGLDASGAASDLLLNCTDGFNKKLCYVPKSKACNKLNGTLAECQLEEREFFSVTYVKCKNIQLLHTPDQVGLMVTCPGYSKQVYLYPGVYHFHGSCSITNQETGEHYPGESSTPIDVVSPFAESSPSVLEMKGLAIGWYNLKRHWAIVMGSIMLCILVIWGTLVCLINRKRVSTKYKVTWVDNGDGGQIRLPSIQDHLVNSSVGKLNEDQDVPYSLNNSRSRLSLSEMGKLSRLSKPNLWLSDISLKVKQWLREDRYGSHGDGLHHDLSRAMSDGNINDVLKCCHPRQAKHYMFAHCNNRNRERVHKIGRTDHDLALNQNLYKAYSILRTHPTFVQHYDDVTPNGISSWSVKDFTARVSPRTGRWESPHQVINREVKTRFTWLPFTAKPDFIALLTRQGSNSWVPTEDQSWPVVNFYTHIFNDPDADKKVWKYVEDEDSQGRYNSLQWNTAGAWYLVYPHEIDPALIRQQTHRRIIPGEWGGVPMYGKVADNTRISDSQSKVESMFMDHTGKQEVKSSNHYLGEQLMRKDLYRMYSIIRNGWGCTKQIGAHQHEKCDLWGFPTFSGKQIRSEGAKSYETPYQILARETRDKFDSLTEEEQLKLVILFEKEEPTPELPEEDVNHSITSWYKDSHLLDTVAEEKASVCTIDCYLNEDSQYTEHAEEMLENLVSSCCDNSP